MKGILSFPGLLIPLVLILMIFSGCQVMPCPLPDASKIMVARLTQAEGGLRVTGSAGAVLSGATVTITDEENHDVTTIADSSGGFLVVQADFPDGFIYTTGSELSITQKAAGGSESNAVKIVINM